MQIQMTGLASNAWGANAITQKIKFNIYNQSQNYKHVHVATLKKDSDIF